MNKIYKEIATLSDKFRTMAFGLTTDENKINNTVQELMLYFLQMNPDTLKSIYDKDGLEGVTRYGAVALKRALRSPRSSFYYKYEKYYTHIDSSIYNSSYSTDTNGYFILDDFNYKDISNLPNEEVDNYKINKIEQIDKVLDNVYWYDKKIFELYYYEGNTLDSLAAKTKISRNSIFNTIDKVRTIIKNKLNEDV